MKRRILSVILLFIASPFAISEDLVPGLTQEQSAEMNEIINEINQNGLKPTDSNIYNICYASSLLMVNAAKDAASGTYNGDLALGRVLLIPHDEYRAMVKELIKSDAVFGINKNPDDFDRDFQMKCRASPDIYIKKYNKIFRRKMNEADKNNQW
ncbi:hypothetical protein AAFL38_28130 [Klebsiella grimontii]|uniref:Uncharacterized protein n=1 Tax=Klebsiella grimontii TaxID=2058152 RepID=A0ABU9P9T1_9ENTR|nr:hypothetical protein [Klebsiella grimontii]